MLTLIKYNSKRSILIPRLKRNLCIKVTPPPPVINTVSTAFSSTPPFWLRVSLVGTSVGICTPVFATLGAARVWYNYLPRSAWGRYIKYAIGILIGGGGTSVIYNYFIPFLRDHSEIVLPFAISNAVTSSFWYTVAEITFGFTALKASTVTADTLLKVPTAQSFFRSIFTSRIPAIGAGIGALTAMTTPLLWPIAFKLCFPDPIDRHFLHLDDVSWLVELYSWIAVPVALPIGILSGLSLHTVLYTSIIGTPGVPWPYRSLPLFAALSAVSLTYFIGGRTSSDILYYEERMVPSTGNIVSINLRTRDIRQDGGEAANLATLKRNIVYTINSIRYYIKDFLLGIISYYPSAVVPIHTLNHAVDHFNTTVVALSRHGEFTASTVGRVLNLAQDMQVGCTVYMLYVYI